MSTDEIVVGYGARLSESVELVDPLTGNPELHKRALVEANQVDRSLPLTQHVIILFPAKHMTSPDDTFSKTKHVFCCIAKKNYLRKELFLWNIF